MDWVQFAVQWLHVLLGITWFGYAISMYFLVTPALAGLPTTELQALNGRLGRIGQRVFPVVGLAVLILGFVRGTFLGPIDSIAKVLGTGYGITWLVALLTTVALFVTGARFLGPTYARLATTDDVPGVSAQARRYALIDLGLFAVVFTCMILMRFGL
jgi:uncharacterized membrane protein